jgi:hypothetical protein
MNNKKDVGLWVYPYAGLVFQKVGNGFKAYGLPLNILNFDYLL